jgi:hypothetical protein
VGWVLGPATSKGWKGCPEGALTSGRLEDLRRYTNQKKYRPHIYFILVYLAFCLFLIRTVVVLYCFIICVCVGGCNVWVFWYYVYYTLTEVFLNLTEVFLNLTEVFPYFFLSCKANSRVKLAKTGHGPHSYTLVVICVVLLLFVLFCCYLCCFVVICVVLCIVCV